MSNIDRDTFSCLFFVKTKWGSNLEFILNDTENAYCEKHGRWRHVKAYSHGRDGVSYGELLWDMLKKEFAKSKTIDVPEYGAYGDVNFTVRAGSPKELENALKRCDKVVARWINRYRINHMKDRK